MGEIREGEEVLALDPADMPADAHVVFIGRVHSSWHSRQDCPKNIRAARETGETASVVVEAPYRKGLAGLERASHVILLSWLDRSARNLIVQKPRHAAETSGTFALRSPVRPNPIGLHIARLTSLDAVAGRLHLEAIDLIDGTPILDIKPYFVSVDSVPHASIAERPK